MIEVPLTEKMYDDAIIKLGNDVDEKFQLLFYNPEACAAFLADFMQHFAAMCTTQFFEKAFNQPVKPCGTQGCTCHCRQADFNEYIIKVRTGFFSRNIPAG